MSAPTSSLRAVLAGSFMPSTAVAALSFQQRNQHRLPWRSRSCWLIGTARPELECEQRAPSGRADAADCLGRGTRQFAFAVRDASAAAHRRFATMNHSKLNGSTRAPLLDGV